MGITFYTLSGVFHPLHRFVEWLAGGRPQSQAAGSGPRLAPVAPCGRALPVRRPLRVVRVVEASHAPASAGRMVISGRMADVCAELERLAAVESAQALAPTR